MEIDVAIWLDMDSRPDVIDNVRTTLRSAIESDGVQFLKAGPLREKVEWFGIYQIKALRAVRARYGSWSESDVAAIVELNDGRWASIEGGCDTTGWDCQSWCDVKVGSLRDVIDFGLSEDNRNAMMAQLVLSKSESALVRRM